MFRLDIFHREEGLQSTGSVALEWAVETMKFTTANHNHIGSDRFSADGAASVHDQEGGVEWSGVVDGRWLTIHITIFHFAFSTWHSKKKMC